MGSIQTKARQALNMEAPAASCSSNDALALNSTQDKKDRSNGKDEEELNDGRNEGGGEMPLWLTALPIELWVEILIRLPSLRDVAHMSLVSHFCHSLANDNSGIPPSILNSSYVCLLCLSSSPPPLSLWCACLC